MNTKNKRCTLAAETSGSTGTLDPELTEREVRYRCTASMWKYALSPLPDDPTLDAWKRDQAIMRALVCGEVLPTTKHQLFNRSEHLPLNMDERLQIKDAQNVLETLCPKYTDAFSEHDRNNLTRWIDEVEAYRAEQIQERREIARLAHVTEVQDHLFFALELAHRFNPAVRKRIEDETRRIKEAWNEKQNAPDKKRGYAAMADRAQATCDAYIKLLNELYVMPPIEEAKPDNSPAASIEQNRPIMSAEFAAMIAEALEKRMGSRPVIVSGFAGDAECVPNDLNYLVTDRKKKKAANAKRGTENQVKGNTEERDRAAADMDKAVKRVHDDPDVKAGKHGAILAACRRVCREFTLLTSKKNALGKYEEYAPLTRADGDPIKPTTLAKNYRERYDAKKIRATRQRAE